MQNHYTKIFLLLAGVVSLGCNQLGEAKDACCEKSGKPHEQKPATMACCKTVNGKLTGACCTGAGGGGGAMDAKTAAKTKEAQIKLAAASPPMLQMPAKNAKTEKGSLLLDEAESGPAAQALPAGHDRPFAEMEIVHRAQKEFGSIDVASWQRARLSSSERMPITGQHSPRTRVFDEAFALFLKQWKVPGATVCVAENGKIVYSRGFGYADLNTRTKMPADARFRIASISKAITAVAVLKLCEQGKLHLNTRAMPLTAFKLMEGQTVDQELGKVTIQNLLDCTAGWDRKIAGDPMFQPIARTAAMEYSNTMRPTRDAIRQLWLGKKLDFIPGTHFSYSNFGYSLLGKIIETASGATYEDFIKTQILKPLDMNQTEPGRTIELASGEATYYAFPGQEENVSLLPNFRGQVALPYGGDFYLESMTADAGLISSSPDLVKFISAVAAEPGTTSILQPDSLKQMLERPNVPEWKDKPVYFAMGFEADRSQRDKVRFYRQGSLPGTISFVCHRPDGYSFAFCANSRPQAANAFQNQGAALIEAGIREKQFAL